MNNRISENFEQIQGFADILTETLIKHGMLDSDLSMAVSQEILEILKASGIPHQVEVTILLQLACAVFQTAELETPACPSPLLN